MAGNFSNCWVISLLPRKPFYITPARKFRMLLHTNPTRERGECLGTRAGASEDL